MAGSLSLSLNQSPDRTLDFSAFRAETKKCFKQDIPLAERNDWEAYFLAEQNKVRTLDAETADLERRIDQAVYCLFGLDPDEIALIEGRASGAEDSE